MSDIEIAVIGGSGFYQFPDLLAPHELTVQTPFEQTVGITTGTVAGKKVAFIARHGIGHRVPPHKINYRANIWALHSIGVRRVLALNAVGGITAAMAPGVQVLPEQIIDYTYGREHTFATQLSDAINHIDFTSPFAGALVQSVASAWEADGEKYVRGGVLGCTQGPRLETAAEIQRLQRDGCDLVGMTTMPEAALARELQMEYAAIGTVVNWAAGICPQPITLAEITAVLQGAVPKLRRTLVKTIAAL